MCVREGGWFGLVIFIFQSMVGKVMMRISFEVLVQQAVIRRQTR